MRTDAGLVSEVYNADNREHGLEITRLIHEALAPRVIGMSIFEGERIWETMFALSHASRDRKTLLEAIACVDCALWDLAGKALGKSVCALLGGYRSRLPIISIGGGFIGGKTLAGIRGGVGGYPPAGVAGGEVYRGGAPPAPDSRPPRRGRRRA